MINDVKSMAASVVQNLGGKRILDMMINAKDFKFNPKQQHVSFRFTSRNALKANFVKISFAQANTLSIEFIRIYGKKNDILKSINNVGLSDLATVFEKETMLALSNK